MRTSFLVMLRCIIPALVVVLLTATTPAADFPSWWTGRGVLKLDGASQPVAPDDFAVVNQGQIKNLALGAFLECEEQLPGGAGPAIEAMIAEFQTLNLALRPAAVATQSSGGFNAPAELGNDGNIDGWAPNGSVFHTNIEPQPWWQVDLQSSSGIKSVELWNRTDCCGERAANLYVLVADTDMSQRTLADLLADGNVWKSPKIVSPPNPTVTVPVGRPGRFVMVRLEGTNWFHLAEVKVNRQSDDFAVATVGQLKAVADPFYTRFAEVGLGMRFLWPVHGNTDDYAVANIGQAKALFNFELDPTVLPTPDPVEGIGGVGSSIVLTWTGVPSATGYRLERRHPFGSGALSQWSTIATPINTATSHTDFAVVLDGIYAYRVFAIRDTQESPPSDEVWLRFNGPDTPPSIPDGDDNGIPDQDEGTGDTDGDGTDDAHDADNDGDGAPDQGDHWPEDSRRSDFVPVKYFGTIDLSKYTFGEQPVPVDGIVRMAINDSNQVSWLRTGWSEAHQSVVRQVITWSDNAIQSIGTYGHNTSSPPAWDFTSVNGINGAGQIAGSHNQSQTGSAVNFTVRAVPGDRAVPASYLGIYPEDNTAFADSAFYTGFTNDWKSNGDVQFGTISYVIGQLDENGDSRQQMAQVVRYQHNQGILEEAPAGGAVVAIGNNRAAVLQNSGIPTFDAGIATFWHPVSGGQSIGRVKPYAVNEQGWVVGSRMYWEMIDPATNQTETHFYENPETNFPDENGGTRKGRGELGLLWTPTGGAQTFQDLLPARFKKQFRDTVPYLVTDNDPATNAPTIVFRGSMLTGQPGQEIWATGVFLWWKELDGTPKIASVAVPAGQFIAIDSINKHLAVSGTGADGNPVLGFPVSFSSTAIEKGFDPPMPGDVHITYGEDDVELSRVRDEDNPEWWTSVCNVTATGEGIVGDLKTNDHIEVHFESDNQAGLCEIIVEPSSRELIDIQVGVMQKQTLLTITGKPASNTPVNAEIGVYATSTLVNGPSGREPKMGALPLAILKVMVMPKVALTLGVWKVSDSNKPETTAVPDVVDSMDVLRVANSAFRQACVIFKRVEEANLESIACAYDVQDPMHILNVEADLSKDPFEYVETFIVETNIPKKAEANVAIVRHLNSMFGEHITRVNDPVSFMTSVRSGHLLNENTVGPFYKDCAHEIGHQLGLSTRRTPGLTKRVLKNHDTGKFPFPDGSKGLMHGDQKLPTSKLWLRHEDWKVAWEFAKEREGDIRWSPRKNPPPLRTE